MITVLLGFEYDIYSFLFFIIAAFMEILKYLWLDINVEKFGGREEGRGAKGEG